MPKGIYKRSPKDLIRLGSQLEKARTFILKRGFKKGHPSFHTENSKKKISLAVYLKWKDPFYKTRMHQLMMGKSATRGNTGKHFSLLHKERLSQSHSGLNHYRWIEDRGSVQRNLRNDPEYLQWVKMVKKRDHNICKLKAKTCKGYNIVHHIKSWKNYPEIRYLINNGITLCQAHHPRTRAKEKYLEPILTALVNS